MKNKKALMTVDENEIYPLNKNLAKSAKQHRIFVGNFKFDGKEKPVRIDLERYLLTALNDVDETNVKEFLENNKDFQDDAKRIIKHDLSESFTDAARFAIVQHLLMQPAVNLAEKRANRSDLANSLNPVDEFEFDKDIVEQAASAAVIEVAEVFVSETLPEPLNKNGDRENTAPAEPVKLSDDNPLDELDDLNFDNAPPPPETPAATNAIELTELEKQLEDLV